jgi:hypothetical protein
MDFLTRVTLTTFTACTVLGMTAGARPGWPRLDLNEVRGLCHRVFKERQRDDSLAERGQTLQARVQRKEQLAHALAEGRLSLPQAAARFGALSAYTPNFWIHVNQLHPSASKDEQLCRYLIDWTETLLRDTDPARAEAASRRLTADLEGRLRRGEPLVAP